MHNYIVVHNLNLTFTALSDPTRRAIVDRLARSSATVRELTGPFELSQQAVSKHLAYLERADLIKKVKVGRESICTLNPKAIQRVSEWASHYRRFWEQSFDKLEGVLAEMKSSERSHEKKRK
jgi:DNA-binding transcriptional ArsR family regulator